MNRSGRPFIASVAILVVAARVSSASVPGTITHLGTLGGTATQSFDINASGQVVGQGYSPANQWIHAFRATAGTITDLGTLGGGHSYSYGINAHGHVVGQSYLTGSAVAHAFRSNPDGTLTDLGTLGGSNSTGRAINDSGVVTGYSDLAGNFSGRAFRFSNGVMTDLGTLGGTESYGLDINSSGQVAGYSSINASTRHAFRTVGAAMIDLGTLGGRNSYADAINDSGQVAGYSDMPGNTATHAFRTETAGTMFDLGTLGGTAGSALGINSSGHVVGRSTTATGQQHAFLYVGTPGSGGTMIDLDIWLDSVNPVEGAKWLLTDAYDLTDNGLLTGNGGYNDGPAGLPDGGRAFILDVSTLIPEPATWSLLTLACAAVATRRRPRT
jgi:probable HAF family extracellular repeat protein